MPALAWHTQQIAETARGLHTDSTDGLTADEASARLAQHGPNTIEAPPTRSLLSLLTHQFRSLIVLLLIVAGGIALAMGDVSEATAIAFVIVLKNSIGVVDFVILAGIFCLYLWRVSKGANEEEEAGGDAAGEAA